MKHFFYSSLQSDRNVVSRLTLTHSLVAVVSYETNILLVYRHPTQIIFVFQGISYQNANRKWSGMFLTFILA